MDDNSKNKNLDDSQVADIVYKKISEGNTNVLKTSDIVSQQSDSGDEIVDEIENLANSIKDAEMPQDLEDRALRSVERLRRMARRGSYSGEFETVEKYIYWITRVPWNKYTNDNLDLENAKELMDKTHHGIDVVKELVLDYLSVMKLKGGDGGYNINKGSSGNAPVLLFTGLQGVGKTTIARSIAESMEREFVRIPVGAIGGVQALRGQSRAFLDAEPGQIVKALVRCGSMNPVIVLDEIDKTSGNSGLLNDIMATLLELLDPEQNTSFIDHYIDYPIDLSKVFFICTSNSIGTLSAALLDRMEVLRFTSYTDDEKEVIAKNYTMPEVLKNSGLEKGDIVIEDDVWPLLIRPIGFDAGLRQLERNLATLARKVVRKSIEGETLPITITKENLREYVLPDQGPLS